MVFLAGRALTAAQLNAELATLQTAIADSGWLPVLGGVGFQNSWANYVDTTYGSARYRKIGKVVHLDGLIVAGSFGVPAFALPVGYRPSLNLIFSCKTSGAQVAVEARVLTTGAVQIQSGTAAAYFSLADITFMVD